MSMRGIRAQMHGGEPEDYLVGQTEETRWLRNVFLSDYLGVSAMCL
jgi:hypothetical protein